MNATQGQLSYSYIDIPAGVQVTFTGDHAVRIRCLGDAVITGTLSVDAPPPSYVVTTVGGPGAVTTGAGSSGTSWSWSSPLGQLYCGWSSTYATAGVHAGHYGSPMPFSLAGGSPSGMQTDYSEFGSTGQCWASYTAAGGGGGTLVLDADGLISVHGSVTANGRYGAASGSGGSILLRGMAGLTVHASGQVRAVGGGAAMNGIIRLDAYGQSPSVLGSVTPSPTLVELPYLDEVVPPTIGANWAIRGYAPRGDAIVLGASLQPGSFTLAPLGTIGIDVATSVTLGWIQVPAWGHDPSGVFQFPVPNSPALIGLDIYTAGCNVQSSQVPRFTNTLHSTV
ncbi:MAG: hypothetical protein KAI24_01565 [Planctomycetes bacterium]|nr:hypothetical protein [Planctomycetota bacterium]